MVDTTFDLEELVSISTGKIDSNESNENGIYPFFTCAPEPLRINWHSFEADAILLSGNNANGIYHIHRYNGKFNAYQRTYVITTTRTDVSLDYLYYFLKLKLNYLRDASQGTATKFLTKKILYGISVKLPSKEVQDKVAHILTKLELKGRLNEQMNKTLESIAQALFKHWFIDFEFPDGNDQPYKSSGGEMVETEMGKIPANFAVRTLENEIELMYGKSLPEQTRKRGQYPVYGSNGIVGFHNEFVEEAPGIIIGRKGSAGSVEFSHDNFWAIDTTYYVHLTRKHDTYFWYYLLKTLNLESMNSHSAVPGLNRKDLLQLHYLKPSPEILHRFNSLISIFKKKEQILLKENSILIDIRDSLLPELISGKIRVPLEDTNV